MISLIALPSADSIIASTSAYSGAFFVELAPLALAFAGITIAGMFAGALIGWIIGAFQSFRSGGKEER